MCGFLYKNPTFDVFYVLTGIEPASGVASEVLKEGTKYLKALICDKVCKAKRKSHSKVTPTPINAKKGKVCPNRNWASQKAHQCRR